MVYNSSMPRFHTQSDLTKSAAVLLDEKESRHALRVLRLKSGQSVELFDPHGHSRGGVVAGVRRGLVEIALDRRVVSRHAAAEVSTQITLAVSVIKPERMELLIQKACELGVHSFWPVLSQRSVVRLSKERWASKIERWRKIALESCKQCGRSVIPQIDALRSFDELPPLFSAFDAVLIPTLALQGESIYNALKKHSTAAKLLLMIGPEGDFSPEEAKLAAAKGALPVTLGSLVLRSETAALYALSAAQFYYREVCLDEKK